MPRLWSDNLQAHRLAVQQAVVAATGVLVSEQGLRAVTMSAIAERSGIGRATLYKYFPDVETILRAWHDGQVRDHLAELSALAGADGTAGARLRRVLQRYAERLWAARRTHGPADLRALVHVAVAEDELAVLLTRLIELAAADDEVRADVPPHELATFCLGALSVARSLDSPASVRRLCALVLDGLRVPAARIGDASTTEPEEQPRDDLPSTHRRGLGSVLSSDEDQ